MRLLIIRLALWLILLNIGVIDKRHFPKNAALIVVNVGSEHVRVGEYPLPCFSAVSLVSFIRDRVNVLGLAVLAASTTTVMLWGKLILGSSINLPEPGQRSDELQAGDESVCRVCDDQDSTSSFVPLSAHNPLFVMRDDVKGVRLTLELNKR